MLYSPYYPFKDHDALCLTVKKADGRNPIKSDEKDQRKQKQNEDAKFTKIYPGSVIIN